MGIREFGIGSAAQGWLWIGTLLSIYQFLSLGIDMNIKLKEWAVAWLVKFVDKVSQLLSIICRQLT